MKTSLYKTRVGEIFVAEAGEGEPLIALHGALTSGLSFARLLSAPPEGFRVLAVDLPGHGQSPPPEKKTAGWGPASDSVLALIEALGFAEVHLLGHSMGGGICAFIAAEHPELVKRLLLVDSATAPFSLPFKGRITRIPGLGELIFKHVYGRFMFFRYFREDIFFDESKIDEASLSAYYDGFDRNRNSALSAVRTAADPGPVYEKLSRIACPTFILWGRNDPLISFRAAGETAARIPGATLAAIEQCGHSPFEEQPDEALRLINQFLST